MFFNELLDNQKLSANILNAWSGPDFEDKDFAFGSIGIEIKLTSSKYPKLKITSERQLDAQSLSELFLILYTTEEVKDGGVSLNSLIEQTKQRVSVNLAELRYFNERLMQLGYMEEDKEQYNKMYSVKKTFGFVITSDFPKIIKSQLPLGVYNTSYLIELSAVEKFITEIGTIIKKL